MADQQGTGIKRFFDSILQEAKRAAIAADELDGLAAAINATGGISAVRLSEKVTGGPARQELCDLLIRRDEAEERLQKQQEKVQRMQTVAMEMIDELEDPLQRSILRQRYLYLWDWARVSDTIGYSISHCQHALGDAMKILDEAFPEMAHLWTSAKVSSE